MIAANFWHYLRISVEANIERIGHLRQLGDRTRDLTPANFLAISTDYKLSTGIRKARQSGINGYRSP
jgi:hypothetical protein